MSFLKNLYKWGVVRTRTSASGAAVLVGAGGVEYPLNLLSTLTLGLAAPVALATGTAIPWDTVIQDDLAIADLAGNPTKLYIPDTVRMLRISYAISYAYNATPGGTYRGINPSLKAGGATVAPAGVRSVKESILPFSSVTEADIVFSSRLIDVSAWAATRYLELKVQHDYGSAINIYGITGGLSSSCSLEMYE